MYKPGQKVQFRVLSLTGTDLKINYDNYTEIYIADPSGTRIAQWLDVDNSDGLLHRSFDLYPESPEGHYSVRVLFPDGSTSEAHFKVEEYVLPRYEVTAKSKSLVYGDDEEVKVTLCANYTFGKPVAGMANISVSARSYRFGGQPYANLTRGRKINGCEDFVFQTKDLLFDQNNCHIRVSRLMVRAMVMEEGTGVRLDVEDEINIHRHRVEFENISPEEDVKLHIPKVAKIRARRPDGSPIEKKAFEVCVTVTREERPCRDFISSKDGVITFTYPSDASTITVNATFAPRVYRNWNDVMSHFPR